MNPASKVQICPKCDRRATTRYCPSCGQILVWPSEFPNTHEDTLVAHRLMTPIGKESDSDRIDVFMRALTERQNKLFGVLPESIFWPARCRQVVYLQHVVQWLEVYEQYLPIRPGDGGALYLVRDQLLKLRRPFAEYLKYRAASFLPYSGEYPTEAQSQVLYGLSELCDRSPDQRDASDSMQRMTSMDRAIEQLFLLSEMVCQTTYRIAERIAAQEQARGQRS